MNVQVVIHSDDGAERNELCPADRPISLGRHPQCVLCLDSDLVSRQHAIVEIGQASIRVEDVSTNGTIAGDRLLRRQMLEVPFGTPIVVGNFTVYFFPLEAPGRMTAPMRASGQQMPQQHAPQQQVPQAPPPPQKQVRPSNANGRPAAADDRKAGPVAVVEKVAAPVLSPQQLTAAIEARKKDVNLRRRLTRCCSSISTSPRSTPRSSTTRR